jgi:hypothetical protein
MKEFISKRELAKNAHVSYSTFQRFLRSRRDVLDAFGVSPYAKKLPGYVAKYLIENYCIDMPQDF